MVASILATNTISLLTSQTNGVEIYQLLAGRDFCKRSDSGQPRSGISQMAAGMSNYVYCIHDSITNQALLIDPCWDVDGIFNTLAQLNITNIETCAYTHHHFDHTGGHLPAAYTGGQAGVVLPGIAEVLLQPGVQKVCAGALDIDKIIHQCRIPRNTITPLLDGDPVFETAHVVVKAMHTPGHTAGSMTFVACNKTSKSTMGEPRIIVTGDTLFIGSCGRYDLPDSNVRHMLMSLEKLSALPSDCIVCPGHNYALPSQTTIGQEKLTNQMMQQAMEVGPQLRNQELQRNTTCGGGSGGSGGGRGGGGGGGREGDGEEIETKMIFQSLRNLLLFHVNSSNSKDNIVCIKIRSLTLRACLSLLEKKRGGGGGGGGEGDQEDIGSADQVCSVLVKLLANSIDYVHGLPNAPRRCGVYFALLVRCLGVGEDWYNNEHDTYHHNLSMEKLIHRLEEIISPELHGIIIDKSDNASNFVETYGTSLSGRNNYLHGIMSLIHNNLVARCCRKNTSSLSKEGSEEGSEEGVLDDGNVVVVVPQIYSRLVNLLLGPCLFDVAPTLGGSADCMERAPLCRETETHDVASRTLFLVARECDMLEHVVQRMSSVMDICNVVELKSWSIDPEDQAISSTGFVGLQNLGCTLTLFIYSFLFFSSLQFTINY